MTAARRARKTSLAIVERAYRGPLEQQYGHIVWLSRVVRKMRAGHSLVLQGSAVLCARAQQEQLEVAVGEAAPAVPVSHYETTIRRMLEEGVRVFVAGFDLPDFGLAREQLIDGIEVVDRHGLHGLFETHDCIWYW